jgi:integrase
MKSTSNNAVGDSSNHVAQFVKVTDGHKRPIRGLWERNGRYYAQLKVEDPLTGIKKVRRVPLTDKDGEPVQSRASAVAEMDRLRVKRADGDLPSLKRTPLFADYARRYLDFIGSGAKKPGTVAKEDAILKRWGGVVGTLRVDQIKRVHVNRFIEDRLKEGTNPRTVNLDVIALRQVLKRARADGLIQRLPTEGLQPLKTKTPKRELVTAADIDKVCAKATAGTKGRGETTVPLTKNGQQFADFVRFMAYSGTRRNEALAMRWGDIDFDRGQITVGADGDTKNSKARHVDFNPKLREHLQAMKGRKAPDSKFLFPSPQRGDKDASAKTFKESLWLVRKAAKLPNFNFHDCRHHFISMAVMSGVDYMTIASWVGHQDGGVLIGKVYGHLANEHKKAMADKLNFGPVLLEAKEAAR